MYSYYLILVRYVGAISEPLFSLFFSTSKHRVMGPRTKLLPRILGRTNNKINKKQPTATSNIYLVMGSARGSFALQLW